MAIRQSRWCWVLVSEDETWLTYLWQLCSICWHMIEVEGHRRVRDTYRYDCHCIITIPRQQHQQNVKRFGSHNRTTQQLWTATLILPDAPRCSQIGWMQSDVLSGAPRLLHRCSWILRKLRNRIQEYPEECIVVFKMLPNQTIRMCKFRSYWEYWPRLWEYSGAPRTWSHTLREWLL